MVLEGFELDGQAVAVQAWPKVHFFTLDNVPSDSDVFEDFVDSVAEVWITVGIWRAIVKNIHAITVILFEKEYIHSNGNDIHQKIQLLLLLV